MSTDAAGYKGFVAGVFSGITKLAVGHPFDTIKVRLQTNPSYSGPIDCLVKTLKNEGVRGLYKGATPPLVGWMFMDSIMLGSLHNYRKCIKDNFYEDQCELPLKGKIAAGVLAGWTVSFVAAPIEYVKALLQVQYNATSKIYSGPIDCAMKLYQQKGIVKGLYHGLWPTLIFRTNFWAWWGSYDILTKYFQHNTNLSTPAINFWAGGLSASIFWTVAYPSDVVKQQLLTDSVTNPQYKSVSDAARKVYARGGLKAFFRGFAPSILRSFPANASALAAFEFAMRIMNRRESESKKLE